jgi:hypothetical protein
VKSLTTIIGYDFYGTQFFQSPSPPVRNIKYTELKNSIVDEIHIRKETSNVDTTSTKEPWQIDTLLLAQFLCDLEAGNVSNSGLQIVKFAIKRRKVNELNSITLGYMDFVNNSTVEYNDYTQANDEYIYSIVPIGENDLEGHPNEISATSNFTGFWLVDKDTNNVLGFDKMLGNSDGNVETTLNQSKVQINTLTKFPSYFYTDQEYHSFTLSTVVIPSEFERSGKEYENILNNFVRLHKPFIIKSSNGEIYVCNVSNVKKSAPLNTWDGYDYFQLSIDAVEVQDYTEFMTE